MVERLWRDAMLLEIGGGTQSRTTSGCASGADR